jgi:hypothetical protein
MSERAGKLVSTAADECMRTAPLLSSDCGIYPCASPGKSSKLAILLLFK